MRSRRTGREGIYTRVVPGKRTVAEQTPKPHAECMYCCSNICQGKCHDYDWDREPGWKDYVPEDVQLMWPEPCEAMFEYLSKNRPNQLLKLVQEDCLQPHDLTFAAEQLGYCPKAPGIREALLKLLVKSSSAMVREGALYGLMAYEEEGLFEILREVASNDPSESVRSVAKDLMCL
jgi:hypothetical protein